MNCPTLWLYYRSLIFYPRDVSKTFTFIALCFLLACGDEPTSPEIEQRALLEFLKFDSEKHVGPSYIENTLYDIQSQTDTMGRAFRITKYLFLTNHHVIDSILKTGKYAQLVKQEKRGYLEDRKGEFLIIDHDKTRDIALLRIKAPKKDTISNKSSEENLWEKVKKIANSFFASKSKKDDEVVSEDQVYYHLYNRVLKSEAQVSEFLRFDGPTIKHKGYQLKFGGFDLYDKSKYVDFLGEFVLPPNSALYEKRGSVLPFQKKEIDILTKNLPSLSKHEILTSIPVYQGESGSPVFFESKKGQYYLAGITTKTLPAGDTISTPEHPLGILAYERTISFIVHRDAILKFIQNYLEKTKKKEIPK